MTIEIHVGAETEIRHAFVTHEYKVCDRCKKSVEKLAINVDGVPSRFSSGWYNLTLYSWKDMAREGETGICDACMYADPVYTERYGGHAVTP